MTGKDIKDQAAHIITAFVILSLMALKPGIITGVICGFALGMVREITEEGERVTVATFIAALNSWQDLLFWTIGGFLAGLLYLILLTL